MYVIQKPDGTYYTIEGGTWDANIYVAMEYEFRNWAEGALNGLTQSGVDMTGAEVVESPPNLRPEMPDPEDRLIP